MTAKSKKWERERIYKILKLNDATNKASWWNIADEVVELFDQREKSAYQKGFYEPR